MKSLPKGLPLYSSKDKNVKKLQLPLFLSFSFAVLSAPAPASADRQAGRSATSQGSVEVSSAADLAALRGKSVIEGDLTIMSFPGETLQGLESLALVKGKLLIFGNRNLTNLRGLENLEMVEGRLSILSNPALKSLSALKKLRAVKEGVGITSNPVLTDLLPKGLRIGETIHNRKGFLQISKNRSLRDAVAQAFARACTLEGRVTIESNAQGRGSR